MDKNSISKRVSAYFLFFAYLSLKCFCEYDKIAQSLGFILKSNITNKVVHWFDRLL